MAPQGEKALVTDALWVAQVGLVFLKHGDQAAVIESFAKQRNTAVPLAITKHE